MKYGKKVFILMILLSFFACKKNPASKISLHENNSSNYFFDSSYGVVNSDVVRLRTKPKNGSNAITTLLDGTVIEILKVKVDSNNKKWCKIQYKKYKGWVRYSELQCYLN